MKIPMAQKFWLLAVMFWIAGAAAAERAEINDAAALAGLEVGKGVFLIDFTNPKKTAFYLDVIRGTHAGMLKQGVEPDFVLVFIGKTVAFLTTEPSEKLASNNQEQLESIATSIQALHEAGVRMEVCAVATEVFDIDNETILPGMNVVADGFISLIGWQNQGYKLVPIF